MVYHRTQGMVRYVFPIFLALISACTIQGNEGVSRTMTPLALELPTVFNPTEGATLEASSMSPLPIVSLTFTLSAPPSTTALPVNYFECPGALPGKLKIGDEAQVNYYQVSARSAPEFSSPKEHVLARGRVVKIINGPQCADQAVWWNISFAGTVSSGEYLEYQAWLPEVDSDTYYLILYP